jgi:hypothetical protein
MNLKTALTISFLQMDTATMSVPPYIIAGFGHYGWGIIIVLAVVWVLKEKEVSTRPGKGG